MAAFLEQRTDLPPYLADLARLEWARIDVFELGVTLRRLVCLSGDAHVQNGPPLRQCGPREQRSRAIEDAMQHTNLLALRNRPVGTLSGGQQQRVGIGQAILNSPALLIVDEPTTGLDPEERIRLRSLLAELGEDRVVLLSTHIAGDIEAVADNLAILQRGQLRFAGTPEELLESVFLLVPIGFMLKKHNTTYDVHGVIDQQAHHVGAHGVAAPPATA